MRVTAKAMCASPEALVLVLPDGRRVPIGDQMTIGRGADATVRIDERTVSRLHARIVVGPDGSTIEDAGSSFGVIVAGRPLTEPRRLEPGMPIELGDVVLGVESAREATPASAVSAAEAQPEHDRANATLVVPIGASDQLPPVEPAAGDGSLRPRLCSGWALKRLADDPDETRYVLRGLRTGSFLELDEEDASLLGLLDGSRTITELLAAARRAAGPPGPGRLARLLADLGDRGMLEGIAAHPTGTSPPGPLRRALEPRERTFAWVADYFPRAYGRWGRPLFTPLTITGLILLSLGGLVTFSYLVGARYGTPLVVAHRLLLGGLVFIIGRTLLVAAHETAHGLALAHYGRRTDRAGLRLVLIFPYAFVDTSEAYFEPRRHRMAISAAGPVSDFAFGAVFSIACAAAPRGNTRDVLFQLAFAAYVGAFLNCNPFLDRDGYHILSDWLRDPRLRERARARLSARLAGSRTGDEDSPVLARYAIAGLAWSLIGAGFVTVLSLRYYDRLSALAPHGMVVAGFVLFFAALIASVALALGLPLFHRARFGTPEVNRVVR